ncbi:glycoside hydrolase family 43 protein [Actinoplanes sp. NPDC026619]|uniref:glycoside hydrolase family 43 protein n=1 Tax=Actinoplanes sp. NPDC026619 TaxID=3155798 RepID=UPI0033D0D9DC
MSSTRKLAGAVLAVVLAVVFGSASPAAAATYAGYAMAYFTESPNMSAANYGLHIAVSSDGLNWTPINQNNPVATPTAGALGLRDPFILRKQDGTFEVIATDLKGTDWTYNSQYIHVWDSTDLRTFTNYRRLKVNSLATHSWAPEAFWDASRSQYGVIYSSVVGGHNVIMVSYTSDFKTATEGQVFFDNGTDVIDGNLVSQGGVNYFYYRGTGGLFGAKSSTLNPGSFTTYTSVINPGRGVEAPQLVPALSGNGYTLWGDTYSPNGRFFAWSTSALSTGSWTLLNDRSYTQPLNSKHLGVTPLTATELSNLLATGTPSWNRIKSYNYPGRYIRHYSNVGRIDEYPFDQWQDQQWKIVPGLADSTGVSFQSVNYPTMYLRHYSYAIQLAASDGTAAFKADATFTKVAGLADSSWTSFRSYNYPDRYLRHSNYVLRIDPISTASEKQDATFKVGY